MPKFIIPIDYERLYLPKAESLIAERIKLVIENLLSASSETIKLDAKTFKDKDVYTLNVMRSHRLLFERLHDGNYLLRGIALHHDYAKALNWQTVGELTFSTEKTIETEKGTDEFCFDNKWLEPTIAQSSFLHSEISFPHLVVGAPGAGKTFVALSYMQKIAKEHQQKEHGLLKILYISSQENLLKETRKTWTLWEKVELDTAKPQIYAVFMTYENLIRENYTDDSSTILSNEELLDIIQLSINRGKATATSTDKTTSFINKEDVLQELLMFASDLSQDKETNKSFKDSSYLAQHSKHSNVSSLESQEYIYNMYFRLMDKLLQESKKFPGLSAATKLPTADFKYDLICADEAQSIPPYALADLINIAKEGQVLYFGDSNQRAEKTLSSLAQLGPTIHTRYQGRLLFHTTLPGTQRLKPAVAELYNAILRLQHNLLGGLPDSTSYSQILTTNAEYNSELVTWVRNIHDYSALESNANAACVVITPNDRLKAQELLGKTLVFTAEEARGLQFNKVLIYISDETCKNFLSLCVNMLSQGILSDTFLNPLIRVSPEKGAKHREEFYSPELSHLMVAVSRSQDEVFIYCDTKETTRTSKLRVFLNWLENKCTNRTTKPIVATASSMYDWVRAVNSYINKDLINQAIQALVNHCRLTQEQANDYVSFYTKQTNVTLDDAMDKISSYFKPICEKKGVINLSPAPIQKAVAPTQLTVKKPQLPDDAPPWMQNYWLQTDVLKVIDAALQEQNPEKWFFKPTTVAGKKITFFEWIFSDTRKILQVGLFLNNKEKQLAWNCIIGKYLHKNTVSNQEITNFEYMLLNMRDIEKFPDTFQLTIDTAIITSPNPALLGRPLAKSGIFSLFMLLAQENNKFHYENLLTRVIANAAGGKMNFLSRKVTEGRYKGANLALLMVIRKCFNKCFLNIGMNGLMAMCEHPQYKNASLLLVIFESWSEYITANDIKHIPIEALHRLATGNHKTLCGTSLLYWLIVNRVELFVTMDDSWLRKALTISALRQEYADKTILHLLCVSSEGQKLLFEKWNIFADAIEQKVMQHKIFINFLLFTKHGSVLLNNNWDFFQDKIGAEMFRNTLEHKPPSVHIPNFGKFYSKPYNINLLRGHWDFFQYDFVRLSSKRECLEEKIKSNTTATPMHYLCHTMEGISFLQEKWDLLKDYINEFTINAKAPIDCEDSTPHVSLLCILLKNAFGRNLIKAHWDVFRDAIYEDTLLEKIYAAQPLSIRTNASFQNHLGLTYWETMRNAMTPATLPARPNLNSQNTDEMTSPGAFSQPQPLMILNLIYDFLGEEILELATQKQWAIVLKKIEKISKQSTPEPLQSTLSFS